MGTCEKNIKLIYVNKKICHMGGLKRFFKVAVESYFSSQ